jgi:hypothetical protein
MAIQIGHEELLTLNEAAKVLQLNGSRPHLSTIWRWCRKGLRGIRLDYVRVGRKIVTSPDALSRFMNELAAADQVVGQPVQARKPHVPTPAAQRAAIEHAERILKRAGI